MNYNRFLKYSWFVVAYTVFVILVGAIVRATGSGAGCGNHWPRCDGMVIPYPEDIETLIEFGHRITSGLSGIFVLLLLVWAFRLRPVSQFVRRMAALSFLFVIVEGFLGAMLVRFELVTDNASIARVIVIGLHLINTLILLAFLTLTAWGSQSESEANQQRPSRILKIAILVGLILFIIMSAAGAITALGDTLFPAESLAEGIRDDFSATAHFLIRLRVYHPVIAVISSIYLFGLGYYLQSRTNSDRLDQRINWLYIVISAQIGGGIINIMLLAPVWMQVIHLLLADTMWILLVLIASDVLLNPIGILMDNPSLSNEPRISTVV